MSPSTRPAPLTPVFYHPAQHASHDFISIQKIPAFIAQSGRDPIGFEPFTDDDFAVAHDPEFVANVFGLRTRNGFGTMDENLNHALRYSSASLWAAVSHVLEASRAGDRIPTPASPDVDALRSASGIACSATQGFHHSGYTFAGGYCTFNGLIIAARKALAGQPDLGRVLIIDGDGHYGNGTDDIIQHLKLRDTIINVTRPEIGKGGNGGPHSRFSQADWDGWTRDLITTHTPGLVIFQSGGDAWDLDPLGSGYLSKEALGHRDRGVFGAAQSAGIPLVWNLAGGYAKPMQLTIDLHLQTLRISDEALATVVG